jgi:hypothetical protein
MSATIDVTRCFLDSGFSAVGQRQWIASDDSGYGMTAHIIQQPRRRRNDLCRTQPVSDKGLSVNRCWRAGMWVLLAAMGAVAASCGRHDPYLAQEKKGQLFPASAERFASSHFY